MDVEKEKEEVSGLFTCPEDGCIQTFQRSSSLQAHLDEGKHKRALEKEILFDKARKGYAARITGEQTKVPTFGFYAASKISVDKLHSTLEMGWALKTTRSRTHFTEEQRKFLTEQFLIGEECGKKADPQQVSQEMRRVRDEKAALFSVERIFFRHSRWQDSSQDWQQGFEKRQQHRTKKVEVKTKSSVQSRQRPYIRT